MENSLQRKLNPGKAIFSPRNTLHLDDIIELESSSCSSRDEFDDDSRLFTLIAKLNQK